GDALPPSQAEIIPLEERRPSPEVLEASKRMPKRDRSQLDDSRPLPPRPTPVAAAEPAATAAATGPEETAAATRADDAARSVEAALTPDATEPLAGTAEPAEESRGETAQAADET